MRELTGREWLAGAPFLLTHLVAIILACYVGFGWAALTWCFGSYFLRMFGIAVGYHRYFSHRSFKTSRWFQFILALLGTTASQRGVLNWSANHRDHHRYSDTPDDPHSPVVDGFWWSHMGWIISDEFDGVENGTIGDLSKYRELKWLNRLWLLPPILYFLGLYLIGGTVALVWGGFVSTVLLWHMTFLVNSICHKYGSRRFQTTDNSRNVWWLAIMTLGESYQNSHHHYQYSANQGKHWSEIDLGYWLILAMEKIGLVWAVKSYN